MTEQRAALADAKRLAAQGERGAAISLLASSITPRDDFVVQAKTAKLVASLVRDEQGLRPLRVALLASSTVDHFADVLRCWLAFEGFRADIWIAPFDTIAPTVLSADSELYRFKPDVTWLFTTHRDVRLPDLTGASINATVQLAVDACASLWRILQSRSAGLILQNNADVPAEDGFGNYAGQNPASRRNALRAFNLRLAESAPPGVAIFDLDHLAALYGKSHWLDARYWFHSKHAFDLNACGLVALQAARLIAASKGRARKCLVLDLDNTLWGGVIGDDGLAGIRLGDQADGEAFVDFQRYVLSLKERGVILAVCSKNDEANAKEPFLRHPHTVLKLEDFAAFVANWNNKADNLREIAETLSIGLDSLVLVDDNPAERELVRRFLPMVAVPELPDDPSEFIAALDRERYFEMVSYSDEDGQRARYYQENAVRAALKLQFADTSEYLESLEMVGDVGDLDGFHLPRMAQLIKKSNQFHLTGTRYGETDLRTMSDGQGHRVRYYKLRDKFGDNGLIGVVIVAINRAVGRAAIDTWVMSCRVLGRSMEEFICNDILAIAAASGCPIVTGRYVPSGKNKLVSGLYERLGFERVAAEADGTETWQMRSGGGAAKVTHVKHAPFEALEARHDVAG